MKITLFQSDKGDCLLLTGADGKNILVDGGMKTSYTQHVAKNLGSLAKKKVPLDLVYVSHIDEDHIAGVLQLVDDVVAWRVYDYHRGEPNASDYRPASPRPPEVLAVWHNAFHEQVGRNAGEIAELLAAKADVLALAQSAELRRVAAKHQELATSQKQAVALSRRLSPEQLNIPLNAEFGGKLGMVREGQAPIKLGGMKLRVIGPFEKDLTKLRTEWNKWLKKESTRKWLDYTRQRARDDEKSLHPEEFEAAYRPLLTYARDIAEAVKLGDRSQVTTPNLASLMLLVEEGKTTVLLTGDGHFDEILEGLRGVGRLDGAGLHVNALKVQHHGSEYNATAEFWRTITADHYVFCGNGAYKNPNLKVLKGLLDSRLGTAKQRSANAETGRSFRLWFNNSSATAEKAEYRAHMKKVEDYVAARANESPNRFKFVFMETSKKSFTV